MTNATLNDITACDLLETLSSYPRLSNFSLALYCEQKELMEGSGHFELCGVIGNNSLCQKMCRASREKAFRETIHNDRPTVFRCPTGLLNFAVPITLHEHPPLCLLGGGVREENLPLAQMEEISNATSTDGIVLLERLEQLPSSTLEEIASIADEVHALLPALLTRNPYAQALKKTSDRIHAISKVTAAVDRASTVEELTGLLNETLAVLFDLPGVAVASVDSAGAPPQMRGAMGLGETTPQLSPERAREYLAGNPTGKGVLSKEEIAAFLPGVQARRAILCPLESEGQRLGMLFLFDADLPERDLALVELLSSRVAAKLLQLQRNSEQQEKLTISTKLVTMISGLALVDSRQDLYQKIVEMSSELLQASQGSLMLIDNSGTTLQIMAAKGLNSQLAETMRTEIGKGIAGKVAQSGQPLLVHDIERDRRIATANRARFRTKSFISLPFKLGDQVIGVLNLADKQSRGVFTDTDLGLLTSFTTHASSLIERTSILERACQLEQLSVTDPLTGLYNRRFLESRFAEELSRSSRLQQSFTIMLIDLDNFKDYNDLCGHIAGDHALKRTGTLLKRSAREMDVVIRYGGEEFCLILPGTAQKESIFVAERIRRAIETEPFPGETGMPSGKLTTSIGVASFPDDGDTAENLLNAADQALYQAKRAGRNRLVLFDGKVKSAKAAPQQEQQG